MERVVIVHGRPDEDEYMDPAQPSLSNAHWQPWLQNQLLINGFDAQTPEMVRSFDPDWSIWSTEFERHLHDGPMSFVGHSCGGGFLLRWLSEHPDVCPRKVVLVAPWIDVQRISTVDFFDFEIDKDLTKRTQVELFHSNDDQESIQTSVAQIMDELPDMNKHIFDGYGHFCFEDMGTVEFPELRDVLLKD